MDLGPVLDDLRRLVEAESPSEDPGAVRGCAELLAEILTQRLGGSAELGEDARVRWSDGEEGSPVLILGHLDTVWPVGTLERMPFALDGERITGPGTYDMKGGLVAVIHALASLRETGHAPPVRLLVTTDEELGSPRSRAEVEEAARRCGRVLIPEPCGPDAAVKTERKGVALGEVVVHGRAAHAGLAPGDGVNAGLALAALLPDVAALADPVAGTTVTPTVLRAGTTVNTVPARAEASIDVRFRDDAEIDRVRRGLAALSGPAGADVETSLQLNRPAMPAAASAPLLPALERAAAEVGQDIGTVGVGGASDGNLAAAAGAAVLDGLSPAGGGAHADDEHITVTGLADRIALLAALLPRVAEIGGGYDRGP